MKPVQNFTTNYLEQTTGATPEQVLQFLEEFRQLHAPSAPSKLISLRVPEPLLAAFKQRCALEGASYQARIKELMRGWLKDAAPAYKPDP